MMKNWKAIAKIVVAVLSALLGAAQRYRTAPL